jgi:hypothetical protein
MKKVWRSLRYGTLLTYKIENVGICVYVHMHEEMCVCVFTYSSRRDIPIFPRLGMLMP